MGKISIETIEISGWPGATEGMRAPMQSYSKNDSVKDNIGDNDKDLMGRLVAGGPEHRKFMRALHVQAKISMPRYWWSEYDTYKIGTTSNSESTMHKLLNNVNPITEEQFYFGTNEEMKTAVNYVTTEAIESLEVLRKIYRGIQLSEQEEDVFFFLVAKAKAMSKVELLTLAKRILPESFIQTRFVDLNYESIRTIYHQRKTHRLKEEWIDTFCSWVEELPCFELLIKPEPLLDEIAKLRKELEEARADAIYWRTELEKMDSKYGHGYFDKEDY